MATDWRKDLTFADRLTATTKMQVSPSSSTVSLHTPDTRTDSFSDRLRTENAILIARERKHRRLRRHLKKLPGSKLSPRQREYHDLIARAIQDLLERSKGAASFSIDKAIGDAMPPDVDVPTSGVVVGRYVNAQHYKDGLFSEVLKAAVPTSEGRGGQSDVVALKVTSPDMEAPPHNSKREARLLQAAKHERVIPLIETFQQPGGRFVMAFPFLPYDLDALLQQRLLTPQFRRSVLKDIFSGLAHLHSLDIIHRDMKPSNILLASPSGPAYLSDFGIAWSPTDPRSEPADEKILDVGTTCYRPPELLFGNQKYGAKLDMWAAGCTAAQIVSLNGQTLFEAGDLGSELALIKSMFETLGTPDLDAWPEAATFPDWGKMNFREYPGKWWPDILPHADADAVDLVSNLVVFESGRRLSAEAALQHPYLQRD